ncbi:Uncharacterised protein [Vibrio cholerae]|nr:Uncharacterised protein [Vibrio cholerae]
MQRSVSQTGSCSARLRFSNCEVLVGHTPSAG